MKLPTLADYQDAIQNPNTCFVSSDLKSAVPVCDNLGLPRAFSGNFAVVFPLKDSNKKWAIRCFATNYHVDQERRYRNLSAFLKAHKMQCMVDFEFISQGIRVKGNWYPILKMEWADGPTLNKYIENNLSNRDALIDLADKFYGMVIELGKHGIAHGDLQHGNILIVNGQLKLVDYDCMFVPGLEGLKSHEIGHKNYQHPKRSSYDFGSFLDNFSAWCIYLSLIAVANDTSLWNLLDAGEENLIFKKEDIDSPDLSSAFRLLENSRSQEVKALAVVFRKFLQIEDISSIPPLTLNRNEGNGKWITPDPSIGSKTENIGWENWLPAFLPKPMPVDPIKPSLSEHALYKLLIFLGGYVVWTILTKNTVDYNIAYTLSAALPSAFALSTVRFTKSAAYQRKKVISSLIHSKQKELQGYQGNEETLLAQKETLLTEHKKVESNLEMRIKFLRQRENTDVNSYAGQQKAKIANLNTQIQRSLKEEADSVGRAQLTYVKDFVNTQLSKHDLESATIQGVGTELKRQLAAHGIRTFGDILDVTINYVQSGRYTSSIAVIKVKGGASVKVPGIGPKKGEALLRHRKSLEQTYSQNLPSTVPPHLMAQIREPYVSARSKLQVDENVAKQSLIQEVARIQKSYQPQIQECQKEIETRKRVFEKETKDLNGKIEELALLIQKKKGELGQMGKENAAFNKVKLLSYIYRSLFF
jgi:serine/threonine protein kinase